jgi:hypothetical protein
MIVTRNHRNRAPRRLCACRQDVDRAVGAKGVVRPRRTREPVALPGPRVVGRRPQAHRLLCRAELLGAIPGSTRPGVNGSGWSFSRAHRHEDVTWIAAYDRLHKLEPPVATAEAILGYAFDSAARFRNPKPYLEHELINTGGLDRGHEIRLGVQRTAAGRIQVPAPLDKHPCPPRTRALGGVEAFVDEGYGPSNATWRDPAAASTSRCSRVPGWGWARSGCLRCWRS